MPTPIFNFRLHPEKAAKVRALARVYGSPTPSHFVRDMIEACTSGDLVDVQAFFARLRERAGVQLAIEFPEAERNQRTERKKRIQLNATTGRTSRTQRNQPKKRRMRERTT